MSQRAKIPCSTSAALLWALPGQAGDFDTLPEIEQVKLILAPKGAIKTVKIVTTNIWPAREGVDEVAVSALVEVAFVVLGMAEVVERHLAQDNLFTQYGENVRAWCRRA